MATTTAPSTPSLSGDPELTTATLEFQRAILHLASRAPDCQCALCSVIHPA